MFNTFASFFREAGPHFRACPLAVRDHFKDFSTFWLVLPGFPSFFWAQQPQFGDCRALSLVFPGFFGAKRQGLATGRKCRLLFSGFPEKN